MSQSLTPAPAGLFLRLRWQTFRNAWRTLFGRSLVRPLSVAVAVAIVWAFVYALSLGGFVFLRDEAHWPLRGELVGVILDMLFLVLAGLLLFSGGLILFGGLFTTPEAGFLLATPTADDRVFAHKFLGATGFSSWGFLLLGAPVLLAYGLAVEAPWYYYALLPPYFVGFLLLPAAVGAIACLLIVNLVPRRRKQVVIALLVVLGAALAVWLVQVVQDARPDDREALNRMVNRFSIAHAALTPSHWAAEGLRAAARGRGGESLYYLALVWSNGLFAYVIAAWAARRLYRRGYNRLTTGGALRRRYGGAWMDRLLSACLPFLHPGTRLLVVKDFRTFRRDPRQWAQVLIVAALLGLYAGNFRRLWVVEMTWFYQNFVSLLNLCVIVLLVCVYTSRFVFPLLSLEGRKFWVLGLLPLDRGQLLWGKFFFSAAGSLAFAEALVLLSDLSLGMPWTATALHALTAAVAAAGLSGLSVGLGACMPNFRETDPSKIASGFGGTMNLLAGTLFLLVVLAVTAAPWHVQMAFRAEELTEPPPWLTALGAAAGVAVGAVAVAVPLRLGVTALRRMEF
jgi:ABC-2 type transport system permease protein